MEAFMTIEELSNLSEKEIILFFAMMTDEEKLFWRQEQINHAIEMEQKKKEEQEQKEWALVEEQRKMAIYNSVFNSEERKLGEMFYDFKQLVNEFTIMTNRNFNGNFGYTENDFRLNRDLRKFIITECERYNCVTQLHDYVVTEFNLT